jgi:hypothetical protein
LKLSSVFINNCIYGPFISGVRRECASRRPSLLIAVRVQKRRVKAVPLTQASKERLKKDSAVRRGSLRLVTCLAVSVLTVLARSSIAVPAGSPLAYTTLNFGTSGTFLTGIPWQQHRRKLRDSGHDRNRGAPLQYFDWYLDAVSRGAANGANFLGAIVSSPYGPGFGSQFGILRAVGSYETQASSPYDFGYLYDGAGGRTEI